MMKKIDFIGGNTRRCLLAMALPMVAAMFLNEYSGLKRPDCRGSSTIVPQQ